MAAFRKVTIKAPAAYILPTHPASAPLIDVENGISYADARISFY